MNVRLSAEDMHRIWASLLLAGGLLFPAGYRWVRASVPKPVNVLRGRVSPDDLGPVQALWLGRRMDLAEVSVEDLRVVPGVGERIAQRILTYQSEHGRFKTLEELEAVKGVGPKLKARLAKYVQIYR
ncbi:MAG: helix-hairpin-helix domain-containing protein [Myxococcales bacterium]|nr:helix-hairpin-helix domain-containing protein [Myxococcales bacterium]